MLFARSASESNKDINIFSQTPNIKMFWEGTNSTHPQKNGTRSQILYVFRGCLKFRGCTMFATYIRIMHYRHLHWKNVLLFLI